MGTLIVLPNGKTCLQIRFYNLNALSADEWEIFLDAFRGQLMRKSGKGAKANKGIKDDVLKKCKGLVLFVSNEFQLKRYLKSFNKILKMTKKIKMVVCKSRKPAKKNILWAYLIDKKNAA